MHPTSNTNKKLNLSTKSHALRDKQSTGLPSNKRYYTLACHEIGILHTGAMPRRLLHEIAKSEINIH